jgi:hypothetical protein
MTNTTETFGYKSKYWPPADTITPEQVAQYDREPLQPLDYTGSVVPDYTHTVVEVTK